MCTCSVVPDSLVSLKVKMLVAHSVWLFVTTWTVACQAPLSMGFSRQEYWLGSLALQADFFFFFFTVWATSEALTKKYFIAKKCWPNVVGKMAPIVMLNAGWPHIFHLLKSQCLQSAIQWGTIKWAMPVISLKPHVSPLREGPLSSYKEVTVAEGSML